ncbi:MAG: hypothetical protein ABJB12_16465 [Pseudomonadota bacterium]
MKSRVKTAAARKSVPPANRKSVAPPARKSVVPPALAGERARTAKKTDSTEGGGKRRLGMRGAAPWAARHAAKHAEEAAARMLNAPKPGSARATLRTPDGADSIKQRIAELHHVLGHIKPLRKNLHEGFFQLGVELKRIQEEKLYEAKGFSSFEVFAERELELGKATALKLTRIPSVFLESAARHFGMAAAMAALDALDEHASNAPQRKSSSSRPNLPLKPPR